MTKGAPRHAETARLKQQEDQRRERLSIGDWHSGYGCRMMRMPPLGMLVKLGKEASDGFDCCKRNPRMATAAAAVKAGTMSYTGSIAKESVLEGIAESKVKAHAASGSMIACKAEWVPRGTSSCQSQAPPDAMPSRARGARRRSSASTTRPDFQREETQRKGQLEHERRLLFVTSAGNTQEDELS